MALRNRELHARNDDDVYRIYSAGTLLVYSLYPCLMLPPLHDFSPGTEFVKDDIIQLKQQKSSKDITFVAHRHKVIMLLSNI